MTTKYQWLVVGAGPAGIASVGKLIDHGVNPKHIAWIDPDFKVGDFGQKWCNVSSNTKVSLFIDFLHDCPTFDYQECDHDFTINKIDPSNTCQLKYAAQPLQWVSDRLKAKVNPVVDFVSEITRQQDLWHVKCNQQVLCAANVVLAYGSEPKTLPGQHEQTEIIPLEIALDAECIGQHVGPDDTVAVIGASHSGIIAVRLLLEAGVKQVINFYRGQLRYAVDMGDWILYDNTGLKGETAKWAKANLSGTNLPERLLRVPSTPDNMQKYMSQCNKAVHAVGFDARSIAIDGINLADYDRTTGIIAPGLFGIGIAFPEQITDRHGNVELSVGLWKFMCYLNRIMPTWVD